VRWMVIVDSSLKRMRIRIRDPGHRPVNHRG